MYWMYEGRLGDGRSKQRNKLTKGQADEGTSRQRQAEEGMGERRDEWTTGQADDGTS